MVFVSAFFYFLLHHEGLTMLAVGGAGFAFGTLLAIWRRNFGWFGLMLPFCLLIPIVDFGAPFANAFFLNAFGTRGSAVIVHKEETDTMLNNSYIWDYDGVLKTADGREISLQFSTNSVAIYPLRNEILIPPENDPFIVKYIPGFERNIVIMCDESNYGKRRKIQRDLAPVERAAGRYAVSPANQEFSKEYRAALQTFLRKHRDDADPDLIRECEEKLDSLEH
jgi:hypothetical protein